MDKHIINILLVEDNPDYVEFLHEILLNDSPNQLLLTSCRSLKEALKSLAEESFDAILLDLGLPDSQGINAVLKIRDWAPKIPIVVLTGLSDETLAIKSVREGAQDYLVKGQVNANLLGRSLKYAIERKKLEEELRRAHDELEIRIQERTSELVEANKALEKEIAKRKAAQEQLKRQLDRLSALRSIDTAITASLDLSVTFNVFLDQVTSQLNVDAACILLFNQHTQKLDYAASRGFHTLDIKNIHFALGESYAGRAALERRIICIPNLNEMEKAIDPYPLMKKEGFVSYYALPLVAKGQIKGVMEIFHRSPLSPDQNWLDFLEALAGQAAVAIDNATLFSDLQKSNMELTSAYDSTLEGWSRALDLRDRETEGHSKRVTEMTLDLARALGMSHSEMVHVRRGALLHDIGKMGIPDNILQKDGPLTTEEWNIMKMHPILAYEMLSPISFLRPALDIPYCHHEKWDGTGYPRGLKGEQIPLAARIFAVADVWDALRSERVYRPAWPEGKVIEYLRMQSGKHFDPNVAEEFLKLINKGGVFPALIRAQ